MSEIQDIDIDKLQIDEMNVRSDPKVNKEMIDSVKQDGILQPLIVRPNGEGYGIVIGGRRYVAGVKADLDELPCEIRELDDAEARRVSLTENLMRENLAEGDEEKAIYDAYVAGLESGVYENQTDMAKKTFLPQSTIGQIISRVESSDKMGIDVDTDSKLSHKDYERTNALKNKLELRKQLLEKRAEDRVRATDLREVAKALDESSEKAQERILSKEMISPREARIIKMVYNEKEERTVEKTEEEQGLVITFPSKLSKKLVRYAIDVGEEPEKATTKLIEDALEVKGYD